MSFRENLRFIMDSKGIQTKELSKMTGISENTVKSYLKTDSAEPKISKVVLIAKALDVSLEFLITGLQNNNAKENSILEYKIIDNVKRLSPKEQKNILALIISMLSENENILI